MDPSLPPGWRSVTLSDLLPNKILKKLPAIMNGIKNGTVDFESAKKKLSDLLAPEEAQLLAKGVVKDYLVYYLINMSQQSTHGEDVKDIGLN